jgi:type IV secretion system protein VirB8
MQNNKPALKQNIQKNEITSWYEDKTFRVTVQRNILFVVSIILSACIIVSLIAIKTIVEKQAIEPYVVKVSNQDQIPISVNMNSVISYANANQSVVEYFLLQYVNLRESYNFLTYNYDYSIILKRMSTSQIFNTFWNQVNSADGVINLLGRNGSINISVKQLIPDPSNKVAVMRISKRFVQNGNIKSIKNYEIKLHYDFKTENLSYKDIVLNPLGIIIDFYEIKEEVVEDQNISFN